MAVLTHSAVAIGLKVLPVVIEAALGQGFSGLQLIGLPYEYSRDARERIKASIEAVGISLPARRLVVSVRPSESLKQFKYGLEHLDLPCAVAIVAALAEQATPPKSRHFNLSRIQRALKESESFFAGQLTLTGEILPQENSLPFEIISFQKNCSMRSFFSHSLCQSESKYTSQWHKVSTLKECLHLLTNWTPEKTGVPQLSSNQNSENEILTTTQTEHLPYIGAVKETLSQFSLHPALALGIYLSAAGRHHLLLSGSPGCGKTFALKALQNLLPPLTREERMDIALIHNLNASGVSQRPFRAPHHSASGAALLGGSLLQPGEVTLAHHGVLFLDELAEFQRPTLEALREPLDDHHISLSRARGRAELPAHFLLLAATNPCPCGYFFSVNKPCRCQASAPLRYQQKLSGPLLERFSILLLIDALMPEASTEIYPESKWLNQFARTWFDSFNAHPEHWCTKLHAAQSRFWKTRDDQSEFIERTAIERHSRGKMWSIRKKAQLVKLCKTINFLFNNDNSCQLTIDEAVELASNLRCFEQKLFDGVHLLTPQQDNMPLKKLNTVSDTLY
ncbi:MAG: hypothetical protein RJB13_574 [Pseudomonadota bacterium]